MEKDTVIDMNLIKVVKKITSPLLQAHDLKNVIFSSNNFFKTVQVESDPKIDFPDADLKEVCEKILDYQSYYGKSINSVEFHVNTNKFFVNWQN